MKNEGTHVIGGKNNTIDAGCEHCFMDAKCENVTIMEGSRFVYVYGLKNVMISGRGLIVTKGNDGQPDVKRIESKIGVIMDIKKKEEDK